MKLIFYKLFFILILLPNFSCQKGTDYSSRDSWNCMLLLQLRTNEFSQSIQIDKIFKLEGLYRIWLRRTPEKDSWSLLQFWPEFQSTDGTNWKESRQLENPGIFSCGLDKIGEKEEVCDIGKDKIQGVISSSQINETKMYSIWIRNGNLDTEFQRIRKTLSVSSHIQIIAENELFYLQKENQISHTMDGGTNWSDISLPEEMVAFRFMDSNRGVAVGKSGKGYFTTDRFSTNSVFSENSQLSKIFLDSDGLGFVYGDKEIFLYKENQWQKMDMGFTGYEYQSQVFPDLPCQF